MTTFIFIWLSQLLSLFGTAMTRFGLTIWAYQQTGQATTLALMGFFNSAAYVIFSPLAGPLVDRWSRKWVVACADAGAGLVTAGLLTLHLTGNMQIWHIYLAGTIINALGAFQEPAFSASVSILVPAQHLTRANGLLSVANDGSRMFAPMLASLLLIPLGVGGIMTVDLVSCLLAVVLVICVRIPQPKKSAEVVNTRGQFGREMSFGFRYIFNHPGLAGILSIFAGINLLAAITYFGALPAMILSRSGGDQVALGVVQSLLGISGVVGGLVLSAWGGPRDRVKGFLLSGAASFLMGDILFGIGRSMPVWIVAAIVSAALIPPILSCYEAIWQTHVPHEVQGRVFSVKNMIQVASMPPGYLLAGWLADKVFEPAMNPGGSLAGIFGGLVGTGPGAGMGLMFLATSVLGMALCLSGLLIPAVRDVDKAREPIAPYQTVRSTS